MPGHDDETQPGTGAAHGVPADDDLLVTRAGVGDADVTYAGAPGGPTPGPAESRPVSRGRYRLGTRLGEGGMAVVVEAEDATLKRPVALKQLRETLRHDAASRAQFFAEAEVLAALEYAGIVPVHDAGLLEDGAPFYAMAKVKGDTLAERLAADTAAGMRVSMRHVEILLRVAETVGHAHGRGFMHLDLKPQNVMVDQDGAVYVMDWGIARRIGAAAAAERGVLRGTPAYMSPEVASGRADLADARSDVFALGVMLYEVLTGRRPFPGDAGTALQAVVATTPPEPRRVARHVPRELSAICMKALAKDPAGRYPTARELAGDLKDFRDFLPVSAVRPTVRDRVVKWLRRHPRAASALGTLAVALLVFGGVRAYRVAAERALLDTLWAQYETLAADHARLEAALAALATRPSGDAERAELQQRVELRADDVRSMTAAMVGLSRGRPDARIVHAMSTRLRHDVESARAAGDFVRMKVLAETRLELIERLAGEVEWPEEEKAFLRAVAVEAAARLEARPAPR